MQAEEKRPFPYEALMESARQAARNAYAPYSRYAVGSALLCAGAPEPFVGCNVENASYGLCICAERVAAASAIAAGQRDFVAIAVFAEGRELPVPCGACRQFLSEFREDLPVAVSNGEETHVFSLGELLPHSFGRRHLRQSGSCC